MVDWSLLEPLPMEEPLLEPLPIDDWPLLESLPMEPLLLWPALLPDWPALEPEPLPDWAHADIEAVNNTAVAAINNFFILKNLPLPGGRS